MKNEKIKYTPFKKKTPSNLKSIIPWYHGNCLIVFVIPVIEPLAKLLLHT